MNSNPLDPRPKKPGIEVNKPVKLRFWQRPEASLILYILISRYFIFRVADLRYHKAQRNPIQPLFAIPETESGRHRHCYQDLNHRHP